MTEEEMFNAYCAGLNNLCKQMHNVRETVNDEEAMSALEYARSAKFRGPGDVLLFAAAINLMNAYVKQPGNRKKFGYSFKSLVPILLTELRMKPMGNVQFCTVRDKKNNVTIIQIQEIQFSFHCIAGETPDESPSLNFDGIKKQGCARTLWKMTQANQLMRGENFQNVSSQPLNSGKETSCQSRDRGSKEFPTNRPKEVTMARYSTSRSGSYRSSGSRSGGFTKSNGTHVSAARAHQHTGTSFGGYTKTRDASTGRYSMHPTSKRR